MDGELKPGEQVIMAIDQKDKVGRVIMHSKTIWAGFDNAQANAFATGIFRGLLDYTEKLSGIKNG